MTTEAAAGILAPTVDAILARASDPFERMAGDWLTPVEGPVGAQRFAAWVSVVAGGDVHRGAEILSRRGLTVDAWVQGLSDARLNGGPEPPWAQDVRMLLDLLATPSDDPTPSLGRVVGTGLPTWVDPDLPWRFFDGFQAWMRCARTLVDEWSRGPTVIGEQAREDLVLWLVRRWLLVAGPSLMAQPRVFDEGVTAGWTQLWDAKPVMARVMAVLWQQWRGATREILDRVNRDLPQQHVRCFSTGDGDAHGGGRSVTRVELSTGRRLYLKPRDDSVHSLVDAVLRQVAPDLRLAEVRRCSGYTWAEEVCPADCTDVAAYYRRAGQLLRVFQSLGARDLHHENFVATAHLPVLVDLETAIGTAHDAVEDLPAATSMVSSFADGPPGTASIDIGAMAGPETDLTPYVVPQLVLDDTGPRLQQARAPITNGLALAHVDGRAVAVADHVRNVWQGYLDADSRLPEVRLGEVDPEAVVRCVPRPTQVYTRLLHLSLRDDQLRDGTARELVLERLWLGLGSTTPDVIAAEQAALRVLDVPLFGVRLADGTARSDRGDRTAGLDAASPLAAVRTRLSTRHPHASDDVRAALFCVAPQARWDGPEQLQDPIELLLAAADRGWVGLDYDPGRFRWVHRRLGPGLLGTAGTGLVLATHAALSSRAHPRAADVARAALLGSADGCRRRRSWRGFDAYTGPAGVVYALGHAARLLGDRRLATAADDLIPLMVDACGSGSRALGPLAGARLACRQLPRSSLAARAQGHLATLTEAPVGDVRDDPYAAALASHEAGAWLLDDGPSPPSRPGNLVALATRGRPPALPPDTDPLVASDVAAVAWRSTGRSAWERDAAAARRRVHDRAVSHQRWFPGLLAPDSAMVSAIHGIGAIVLLDHADNGDAPIPRVMT
jgi:hypothetical protein